MDNLCPVCKKDLADIDLPIRIHDIFGDGPMWNVEHWRCPYCHTQLIISRDVSYKITEKENKNV